MKDNVVYSVRALSCAAQLLLWQVQSCPSVNFTRRGHASLYPIGRFHIWTDQLLRFLGSGRGWDGWRAINTVGDRLGSVWCYSLLWVYIQTVMYPRHITSAPMHIRQGIWSFVFLWADGPRWESSALEKRGFASVCVCVSIDLCLQTMLACRPDSSCDGWPTHLIRVIGFMCSNET